MRRLVWLVCALLVGCGEQHAKRISAVETAPDAEMQIAIVDGAAGLGIAPDAAAPKPPLRSATAGAPWDLVHAACDAVTAPRKLHCELSKLRRFAHGPGDNQAVDSAYNS